MKRALRIGTLVGAAAALMLGLMAPPAMAADPSTACTVPVMTGAVTPLVSTGGQGVGTTTVAVGTAHCSSLDGHNYTLTLRAAVFYSDATLCGSEQEGSSLSRAGQAEVVLRLTCFTPISDTAHALSTQLGHIILSTSDGVQSDRYYPIV